MWFYEAQLSEPLKEIRMYFTGSPPSVAIRDAIHCHLGLLCFFLLCVFLCPCSTVIFSSPLLLNL